MRRVGARNTAPEKAVRSLLHRMGYRFRLHRADLPGKPDIVMPSRRKVIFVHGCFWHGHPGCSRSARPATNTAFGDNKIGSTIERDRRNIRALREAGWDVLVIWQCEMRARDALHEKLTLFLATH